MSEKKNIRGISINKSYKVILHTEGHTIISDEPLEEGGSDEGMNPYELLVGSLASCTLITIQMYLERKKWEVDELLVDINLKNEEIDGVKKNIFTRNLIVKSKLGDAELERIKHIANVCPISRILETGNNSVITTLEKRK